MSFRMLSEVPSLDFFKPLRFWLAVSILGVLFTLVILPIRGLNYGVDFLGGTLILAEFPESRDIGEYRAALSALDVGEPTVTEASGGSGGQVILMRVGNPEDAGEGAAPVADQVRAARGTSGDSNHGWPPTFVLDDDGRVVPTPGTVVHNRTDDPGLGPDFASPGTPTGAAVVTVEGGKCKEAHVAVTGVGAKATRAKGVEAALAGKPLDAATIQAAAAKAADGIEMSADLQGSVEYKQHLTRVYARRALEAAAARAK